MSDPLPSTIIDALSKLTTNVLTKELTGAANLAMSAARCGAGHLIIFRPPTAGADTAAKRPNVVVALMSGLISDADLDQVEETLRKVHQDILSDGATAAKVERDYRKEHP